MSRNGTLDQYRRSVAELNSTPSLHFIYNEKDIESFVAEVDSHGNTLMAVKKGLLYANHIVILTKERVVLHKYGDGTDNNFDDYDLLFEESNTQRRVSKSLDYEKDKERLLRYTTFLPEKLTYEEHYTDSFYHTEDSAYTVFDFKQEYHNKAGVQIALSTPNTKNHIFEKYHDSAMHTGIINVWLPEIRDIPLETLLRIRQDEADSFIRFQHSIKKFLNGLNGFDSEAMLLELFQHIDYHVREMEQKMINLSKMKALASINAIVGSALMGLTFFLPPDVARAVIAVLGGFQLKEYKDKLSEIYDKRNELKSSDFYVPWLMHDECK
jgi:hypothetical protein